MTTVASTLRPFKQTTGWRTINLKNQNDEATVPHKFRKLSEGQSALTKHFTATHLLLCLSFSMIFILSVSFLSFFVVIYCNVSEQLWHMLHVNILLLPLIFSRKCYCGRGLTHTVEKEHLLKNTHSTYVLTAVASLWNTSGSEVHSHELVSCEENILCPGSQEEQNSLLLEGGGMCLMCWEVSPSCLDWTSSWLFARESYLHKRLRSQLRKNNFFPHYWLLLF